MKEFVKDGYCIEKESINFESKKCEKTLPRSIWQTYSAFANTAGGYIVLGFTEVENNKLKLTGVDNPEKIVKDFWDLIHNKEKVSINILTDDDVCINEYADKKYIVIHVPRADRHNRPVYIDDNMDNGTYRRNNEGDYHCTRPEILEMGRDASDTSTDQLIIPGSSIGDLDLKTLTKYRNLIRANNADHPWLRESDEEFLRLIGAAEYVDDKILITNAGMLMFGMDHRITRIFPSYHLDYLEYKNGIDWSDRIFSDSGLWSGNLFDFYLEVANRLFRSSSHPFSLEKDKRNDTTDLITAVREAVLNSIIHADYNGTCGITIELHNESICVRNPGCFRIPPEKAMKGGYTDARNPVIMKMFTLVGFVERAGSGIYRIMRTCAKNGIDAPSITEETNPNIVSFKMMLGVNRKNLADKIMSLIETDDKITIIDMSEKLQVSPSTIARMIKRLNKEGKLIRISGPRGYWKIQK